MITLDIVSNSAKCTHAIGVILGKIAMPGDVVLLVGELGVGKTCLTQGIASGMGIEEDVLSPSYVLLREYRGRFCLYHMDFYRLEGIEEVAPLGLDDYLNSNGVCVMEWADKVLDALPREHLLIKMKHYSTNRRILSFMPYGKRYIELLSEMKRAQQIAAK